jgi:hypothetical protein
VVILRLGGSECQQEECDERSDIDRLGASDVGGSRTHGGEGELIGGRIVHLMAN